VRDGRRRCFMVLFLCERWATTTTARHAQRWLPKPKAWHHTVTSAASPASLPRMRQLRLCWFRQACLGRPFSHYGKRYHDRLGARLWQMVHWDLATGQMRRGQWCKLHLALDQCFLSPDGEHFSYTGGKMRSSSRFFADYQRLHGINPFYTVVCRPPFWSAVALFDQRQDGWAGDRFGGGEPHYADLRSAQGAHWRSSSHLVLGPFHGTGSPFEGVNLGGEPRWPATPELAPSRGAIADGITISQDHTRVGGVWRPRPATLVFRSTHAPEDQPSDINRPASVIAPGTRQAEQLGLPTSFDVAWRLPRSGRCVIARGGELLELLAPATEARPARTSRIADFRDDQFSELAPPPWATRWACEPQGARPSGDVGEPVAVKGGVTQQGREGTAPRSAGGVA